MTDQFFWVEKKHPMGAWRVYHKPFLGYSTPGGEDASKMFKKIQTHGELTRLIESLNQDISRFKLEDLFKSSELMSIDVDVVREDDETTISWKITLSLGSVREGVEWFWTLSSCDGAGLRSISIKRLSKERLSHEMDDGACYTAVSESTTNYSGNMIDMLVLTDKRFWEQVDAQGQEGE